MRRLLILFISIFSGFNSLSQYRIPYKEDCLTLKDRILAVQLFEEKDEYDKALNEYYKQAAQQYLNFSKSVEFMGYEKMKALMDSKNASYAVLVLDDEGYNISRNRRVKSPSTGGNPYASGIKTSYTAFSFSNFQFRLILLNQPDNNIVTNVGFGSGNLIKCDILFLVQQLSRLVDASLNERRGANYYNVDNNIKTVQSKTLLIPAEFLKEGEDVKIPKYYKYKYEVKPMAEIDSIALTKDSSYTYLKVIWSNQHHMYAWSAINMEDCRTLSITGFGGVHYGTEQTVPEVIKVNQLSYITSKMAQGMNNRYK